MKQCRQISFLLKAAKTLVFLCAVVSPGMKLCAQQDWNYTQYLFNLYDANAAYAGNHHAPSFAMRHRAQWMNIEGSPQTSVLTFHSPALNEKIGWGFRIQQENIGAREQWMFRPSIAYKAKIRDGQLSMALAPAVIHQAINPGKISARDESDPQLNGTGLNSTSFSADAAIMFSTLKWFAGAEFNHLNRSRMNWSASSKGRYFTSGNAVAGYLLKVSDDDLIAFTAMVRFTEHGRTLSEGNITWLWNNLIWLGAGYRPGIGPDFLVEWNVSKRLRLGYSFDLPTSAVRTYQDSSHEIFLGFNLPVNSSSSIRYF